MNRGANLQFIADEYTSELEKLLSIAMNYWQEYFDAGMITDVSQILSDHDRMWWDWLQKAKAAMILEG